MSKQSIIHTCIEILFNPKKEQKVNTCYNTDLVLKTLYCVKEAGYKVPLWEITNIEKFIKAGISFMVYTGTSRRGKFAGDWWSMWISF